MATEITIGKTVLQLEEYNGIYSLVEGWINRDGVFKPNWCKRQYGNDAPEKNYPVKIKLGNKEGLKSVLNWLQVQFGDEPPF
jgi:hypothetical protein